MFIEKVSSKKFEQLFYKSLRALHKFIMPSNKRTLSTENVKQVISKKVKIKPEFSKT